MRTNPTSQGKSLLDTYLDYHNLTLRSTTSQEPKRDGMPFMPMLLMDAMNLLYEEYIAPLPLKHREKQLRTRWHDAYKHYISQEFLPFSDDQKCEICDLMNDFEEYIHNEVEIFRVASMNKFMKYDTDIRITLSAILACNALAQSAQILYKAQRRKENDYIVAVESWSYKLLNEYADKKLDRSATQTDLNKYQDLSVASKNMCNAIIDFAQRCKL
jgi:hypothetical protein